MINALLDVDQPSDQNIVDAARLVTRYRDSLLSRDLTGLLRQVLQRWGMTSDELYTMARTLWQSGWRPSSLDQSTEVGSGADVQE